MSIGGLPKDIWSVGSYNSTEGREDLQSYFTYLLDRGESPNSLARMLRNMDWENDMSRGSQTTEALKNANNTIKELKSELQRISEEPLVTASIIAINQDGCFINIKNMTVRVAAPVFEVKLGDGVLVHGKTNQIVAKLRESLDTKILTKVTEILPDGRIGVDINGKTVLAEKGDADIQVGDRVTVGAEGRLIMENLGQTSDRFSYKTPEVTWDDVSGLQEAKAQMIEAVELPHTHKELFEFYGKKPTKGLLLYGAPGCGKTLLGKAAANALAKVYGVESVGDGFMYIKGPEILDKYVGEAEATVRSIFERARAFKRANGYPAVVFIDEADAVLSKRGDLVGTKMASTVVPMFLTEMDGMEESAALIILATNRQDSLDPAIVRDGRIDRKIRVTRPDLESAKEIILMNLLKAPVCEGVKVGTLVDAAANALFSDDRKLYKVNTLDGYKYLLMRHIINGAMLANVVEVAISLAIRRDITNGFKSGITETDIIAAVNTIDKQNRDVDHSDALNEVFGSIDKDDIAGIKKVEYVEPMEEEDDDSKAA